ncbi:MAG: alanine--glyoxylate aminotransferase family protein [Eubacterium sp.]|nr:alanine--glyoxylate aminotransferase family protein [Eubacterium sp.]
MFKIMTAGPTQVRENVRLERSKVFTNPDLDPDFFDFYKETCELLSKTMNTQMRAFIMGGEGILGLEAACASLTEEGDRVLVIDNGIFGKGFEGFVTMYGGEATVLSSDYRNPVKLDDLRAFLSKDSDFKYATVVHCDTPSGVMNDVEAISRLLDEFGIMTVCDSVAGMFGEPLNLSKSKIDILCGGSQKALSAPPGLTMVWVSDRAFEAMKSRKSAIRAFYANILLMEDYYKNQWFPYTMPISDIMGLRVAIENYLGDLNFQERHSKLAKAVRKTVTKAGLGLYLESGFSNNVTVIEVPQGITDEELLNEIREDFGILISGCFDVLKGKVVRIGHMGENANVEDIAATLDAMQKVLLRHGIELKCNMMNEFLLSC